MGIGDPFLYLENEGRRAATVSILDAPKVVELGIEVIDATALGGDDLIASGVPRLEIEGELCLRAAQALGVTEATVPPDFPLFVADHLRANGIELTVDDEEFMRRRRVKSEVQLAGIRRAQKAADAAMATARDLIHALRPGLLSEDVRAAMQAVAEEHGCELSDDAIVSHGGQAAIGHESGSGEIGAGEPVVVDIWPRDRASRCYADMTRTFVAGGGEPPEELAEYWRLTKDSLERVYADLRAGASGRTLFERSCEPYIEAGQPTQLTKEPGKPLEDGYFDGLGHGIGLEVHERPFMGRIGDDLVVVTADGYEVLTDFPYDL